MAGQVSHVLDACAAIAYLRKEEGGEKVARLIEDKNNRLEIHAANLGEVLYVTMRDLGEDEAKRTLHGVLAFARMRRLFNRDFLMRVARWKANWRIAYGDAFALALAEVENVPLVTTDHRELDPIAQAKAANILWLR